MYKKLLKLSFGAIVFSVSLVLNAEVHYEVLKPASAQVLRPVVAYINKHREKLGVDEYERISESDGYCIDINNDGNDEYVFLDYQGSGNYLYFHIFAKRGKKFVRLSTPAILNNIEEMGHPFYHEPTQELQLFIRVQGRVYVCGVNGWYSHMRHIYEWDETGCRRCTRPFLFDLQQKYFHELYDAGYYLSADTLLSDFIRYYQSSLSSQQLLELKHNQARAALKAGHYHATATLLSGIMLPAAYLKTSKEFQSAVEQTAHLLVVSHDQYKKNGTRGQYDYRWLATAFKAGCWIGGNGRFDYLLTALVPDMLTAPENTCRAWTDFSGDWKHYVAAHMGVTYFGKGSCAEYEKLCGDRYLFFGGFWPHNATQQGFIWCDMEDQVSAFAIGVSNDRSETLYIGSCSLEEHELPAAFFKALRVWMIEANMTPSSVIFYDRLGRGAKLQLP